jgi:hypothetical protein
MHFKLVVFLRSESETQCDQPRRGATASGTMPVTRSRVNLKGGIFKFKFCASVFRAAVNCPPESLLPTLTVAGPPLTATVTR